MPTAPHPRLFPLRPLLDAAELTESALARHVHANGTAIRMAAAAGCTVSEADRWAVRCGFHPAEIWPDWNNDLTEGAA
jgi:hypothetical protein